MLHLKIIVIKEDQAAYKERQMPMKDDLLSFFPFAMVSSLSLSPSHTLSQAYDELSENTTSYVRYSSFFRNMDSVIKVTGSQGVDISGNVLLESSDQSMVIASQSSYHNLFANNLAVGASKIFRSNFDLVLTAGFQIWPFSKFSSPFPAQYAYAMLSHS